MSSFLKSGPDVERERLSYIDGLRGMAILGVLAVHLSGHLVWAGARFRNGWFQDFLSAGARGVQLFFMISAFTLFASAMARRQTDSQPVLQFYIRRAFRILPLWWLTITIFSALEHRSPWPSALMYFGFLRFDPKVEVFSLGWSIFVEEVFYLLFPFILLRINTVYRSFQFVAVTWLLAIAWDQFAPRLGVPTSNAFVFLFPLNHWFCFAIGVLLFHLAKDPEFVRTIITDRRWAIILDAFTIILLFTLIRGTHMAASIALVVLFIACMSPSTFFGRLARNPVLGRFGICCYSIYLFHLLVLRYAPHPAALFEVLGLGRASADIQFLIAAPFFAGACLVVGLFSWTFFERPLIALGRLVNTALASESLLRLKIKRPSTVL